MTTLKTPATIRPGINIYSGEEGLGAALTNPTELAKRKGMLTQSYPITVDGRKFLDVETAYFALRTQCQTEAEIDDLMTSLIAIKLQTHPALRDKITEHGGSAWLEQCSHFTSSKRIGISVWEGEGSASKFIKLLIKGYERSLLIEPVVYKQSSLF